MQTAASAKPARPRTALGIMLLVIAALVLTAAGFVLYAWSQLGSRPDGSRVTLVFPGGAALIRAAGSIPVTVADDLRNLGVEAEQFSLQAEDEAHLFLRREKWVAQLKVTAGNQPVDVAGLGYRLFDKDGKELGAGALRPDIRVDAGQNAAVQIADPELSQTARIEIRKLP